MSRCRVCPAWVGCIYVGVWNVWPGGLERLCGKLLLAGTETSDGPKGRTETVLGHCLAPRVEGGLLAGSANCSGVGTATRHPLQHVSAPGFNSSAQEEPLQALPSAPCCSGGHMLPS